MACSAMSTRCTSTAATTTPRSDDQLNAAGVEDLVIQKRRKSTGQSEPMSMRLGLRWIVEATNSWLANYGQLRRNTDRRSRHRHAVLCLASTILLTVKLIAWRDRYLTT